MEHTLHLSLLAALHHSLAFLNVLKCCFVLTKAHGTLTQHTIIRVLSHSLITLSEGILTLFSLNCHSLVFLNVLKCRLVFVRAHGALTQHELAIRLAHSQVATLLVSSSVPHTAAGVCSHPYIDRWHGQGW